jgi:pyrimidine-nucleoside phosphorylase
METVEEARELARRMVAIGHLSGREVVALLSDMNQPLGNAVGNALEVREAIQTLHGGGPADFREHCLTVASYMLVLGKQATTQDEARVMAEGALNDGRAWKKFRQLVEAQGGDVSVVDHPEQMPTAGVIEDIPSPRSGWLSGINARVVGETSVLLGAGRQRKSDLVDHSVGIMVHYKVGDWVETGSPVFTIHARSREDVLSACASLLGALSWSEQPCSALPLFYDVVM